MSFLKNINKKTIFFFALFAFFIFFPFQKADAYCGDGAVEPVQGEECDSGQALPNFRIEDANQCILNFTRDCQSDCTASFGFICKDAPYPGVDCAGGLEYSLQICEPRCGNGVLEPAYERCDEGALNGVVCTPNPTYSNPPTTCQYCDSACRELITVTGNYCGDGVIELVQGESCDGSNLNGQTCPSQGFLGGSPLLCKADCSGFDTSNCFLAVCGNNVQEGSEVCDGTDLGSGTCQNQPGGFSGGTISCNSICNGYTTTNCYKCGDGVINSLETCDQGSGNVANGDGCNSTCQVESGYSCTGAPSVCTSASTEFCGDHIKNGDEECDYDAGTTKVNGDGCSTDCKVEEGFTCYNDPGTTPPNKNVCVEYCGNGRVNGTEYCDDGNFNNGDGCSACEDGGDFGSETKDGDIGCANGCKKEFGFVCEGFPFSTCKTQCGDGQCAGGTAETCVNCPGDCGMCSIGQRPGVSAVHDRGVFTSLFDKIKTFIFQPQPVIQIPGMNLGQTKINEEFILPPPPIEKDYEIGQPTMTKIGDEYYTITVQSVGDDGSVSFTIK